MGQDRGSHFPQAQSHTFVLGFGILLLGHRHFVHVNVLFVRTYRGRMEDTASCESMKGKGLQRKTVSPRDIAICLGPSKNTTLS